MTSHDLAMAQLRAQAWCQGIRPALMGETPDEIMAELSAQWRLMREALEAVEWVQREYMVRNEFRDMGTTLLKTCPWCGGLGVHKPDCLRQRALGLTP